MKKLSTLFLSVVMVSSVNAMDSDTPSPITTNSPSPNITTPATNQPAVVPTPGSNTPIDPTVPAGTTIPGSNTTVPGSDATTPDSDTTVPPSDTTPPSTDTITPDTTTPGSDSTMDNDLSSPATNNAP